MQTDARNLKMEHLHAVGVALEALLLTVYRLTHRHNQLKQHAVDVFTQLTSMTNQMPPEERPQAVEAQKKLLARQTELCQGLVNNDSPIEEHMLHPMQVIKSLADHQHVEAMDIRDIVGGIRSYQAMTRRPKVLAQDVASSVKHREPSKDNEHNTLRSQSPGLQARPFESPPFLPLELNPMTRSVEALVPDAASLSLPGPESWAGPFESPPRFPLEYNAMTRRVEAPTQDTQDNASFSLGREELSLSLEKDFTTYGPRGNLDCPFSLPFSQVFQEMTGNTEDDGFKVPVDTCGDLDPIRLDLEERRNGNSGSSAPAVLCPIRFADRHTREEVADYVKRHKHQVPADHTACMKKYMEDPETVRMLDSKYGDDMAGMAGLLDELSASHLNYLPPRDQPTDPIFRTPLGQEILHWRQGMDRALLDPANADPAVASATSGASVEEDDQDREHLVRVGECIEHPWGISKGYLTAPTDEGSAIMSSDYDPTSPLEQSIYPLASEAEMAVPKAPTGKCPFGFDAIVNATTAKDEPGFDDEQSSNGHLGSNLSERSDGIESSNDIESSHAAQSSHGM